jgi:transcriptional regulator NrdR family protein
MTIYKIKKRNGAIETFEKGKIYAAIKAAFEAVDQEAEEKTLSNLVHQVLTETEHVI